MIQNVLNRSNFLQIWYNVDELIAAWDHLIVPAAELNSSATYQHDIVDVTRQVLQTMGSYYYTDIMAGFKNNDSSAFL